MEQLFMQVQELTKQLKEAKSSQAATEEKANKRDKKASLSKDSAIDHNHFETAINKRYTFDLHPPPPSSFLTTDKNLARKLEETRQQAQPDCGPV